MSMAAAVRRRLASASLSLSSASPSQRRRMSTAVVGAVHADFEAAIGNTPLIRLNGPSEATGCEIYGKAEFLNPGGSVKDRAALSIIQAAERSGALRRGGTIVEGTAGNTGIGLTAVANTRGVRTIIVINDNQTQEKKDALRQLGAVLVEVPAVPYSNENNYQKVSRRLATELGAVWANQFENLANRAAHVENTGPEIWSQTDGKVDAFSCAVGTGGTLTGTGIALRELSGGKVKIGLTDPRGAALYRYFRDGELASEGDSISEGIGQGRITANLEGFTPDMLFEIGDEDGLRVAFDLLRDEGLALGLSSGINVAGAMEMARELGPGHTVVTILCDRADRYASKMFNIAFLRERGLPTPEWLEKEAERNAEGGVEAAVARAVLAS